ncbi:methyltransferase [Jiangella anatolica]|uniref:Methyltransferase n=2 Tax=Jiangella anatolica TaxID=2670374 RepID=A0A2W2BJ18_9ACTN|nr:methyltransferase [Jiangella anatolica]
MVFGSLSIAFDATVLRPRPWTVHQARWAAELIRAAPPGPVLELCAGAGQIGLLAVAGSDRHLVQVDADPAACRFAGVNAARSGRSRRGRVEVRRAGVDDALRPGERFALILADPPWVPSDAVGRFPDDPVHAIDGGPDGLDVMRRCLTVIGRHLAPGGSAVVQLGTPRQALTVGADSGPLRLQALRSYRPRGVLALLGGRDG